MPRENNRHLDPGLHYRNPVQLEAEFAQNDARRDLARPMTRYLRELAGAGSTRAFIAGEFASYIDVPDGYLVLYVPNTNFDWSGLIKPLQMPSLVEHPSWLHQLIATEHAQAQRDEFGGNWYPVYPLLPKSAQKLTAAQIVDGEDVGILEVDPREFSIPNFGDEGETK